MVQGGELSNSARAEVAVMKGHARFLQANAKLTGEALACRKNQQWPEELQRMTGKISSEAGYKPVNP